MVKIRAHHLLCLLGYKGFGYSEGHTKKMWETQRLLFSFDSQFEISDSPDDICLVCPYLKEGGCRFGGKEIEEEKIRERDRGVIVKLGLKTGSAYTWKEILERLKSFSEEDLSSLCSSCYWFPYGYCLDGLRKIKVQYDHR